MSDLANRLRGETMPFRDLRTTRRNEVLYEAADHIEKLEAVLRTYACNCGLERDWLCEDRETSSECGYRANKALEELK